jgi:hypothetical protein
MLKNYKYIMESLNNFRSKLISQIIHFEGLNIINNQKLINNLKKKII